MAQGMEPIADAGKNWDLKPMILCAPNGVVELKTGDIRKGRPEDRITYCTKVEYDPDAKSELWEKTLLSIFENDQRMVDYMQRLFGYSLSGTAQDEMFPLLYGGGRNGKGTVVEAIRGMLGDYADDLLFASLEKNARGAIANDMAKLPGKRFVTASETEGSVRLNEPRIKQLTGGDPVTCRFLRCEFFTFTPMFVLCLATNDRPEIRDYSDGFWERVQLVPFLHQYLGDERDPTVKIRLKEGVEHQKAILAWAVRGCLEWQKQGLNPRKSVKDASESYRKDSQPLNAFLEDTCTVGDDVGSTQFKPLWNAYEEWAGKGQHLNRRAFSDALGKLFQKEEIKQRTHYRGIRIGYAQKALVEESSDWTTDVPPAGEM